MKRTHAAALLALLVAIPAATAGSLFAPHDKPCFTAGDAAYRISDGAAADVTVRIDNAAAHPDLRMQLTDDAASADFVLVDDADTNNACQGTVQSIRIDPAAHNPDLTVALSRAPAAYKIYVRSAGFSREDAAALFAVLWRDAGKTARQVAARD
jgi:hypothetical protein